MREEIQQLIAEGRTEDALALLVKHNSEAVLLQARYNQAKKQQNMGMIDFGEWSRVQSQVNYAALEMAGQVKPGGGGGSAFGGGIAMGGGSAVGGGTGVCGLSNQNCSAGSACMVSDVTNLSLTTACFAGACDLVGQNCPSGTRCDYAGTNPVRTCVAAGSTTFDQVCTASSACARGLVCISAGTPTTYCAKYCYVDNDCPSNFRCLQPLSVRNNAEIPYICARWSIGCNPLSSTSCNSGESCQISPSGTNCGSTGSSAIGITCTDSAGQCITGTTCFDDGRSTTCREICNVDGGVPGCSSGSCRAIVGHIVGVCL